MIYQHPLAYLLGVEGLALLHAYAGGQDRSFVEARIGEIRALLNDPRLDGDGIEAHPVDTVAGYGTWSTTYDDPGNGLFTAEEKHVHQILQGLPIGDALDAACGTGRHTQYLTGLGHRVVGVDSSPDMLALARARVREARFLQGDLSRLPLPDASMDIVLCTLALTHLPELAGPMAEFARVLRPGGHLVISDVHHEWVALGSVPHMRRDDGAPGLLPAFRHRAGDYLAATLPRGLQLRSCEEPVFPGQGDPKSPPANSELGPWDLWPWTLLEQVPAAMRTVQDSTPVLIIWHFQRPT